MSESMIIAILGVIAAIIARTKYIHIIHGSNRINYSYFTIAKSLCSLGIPGMGQFLDGQFKKGLAHFIFSLIFWIIILSIVVSHNANGLFLLPGLLPHIFSSGEATKR